MRTRVVWISLVVLVLLLAGVAAFAGLRRGGDSARAELTVEKLTCGSCAQTVRAALGELPGVGQVEVNVTTGRAVVAFDPQRVEPAALAEKVSAAGYPAQVAQVLSAAEAEALRTNAGRLAEKYVARIGDRLVSREEFAAEVERLRGAAAAGEGGDEAQLQRQAWQAVLQRELVLADAASAGVVVQPGELTDEIARMSGGSSEFAQMVALRFGGEENFSRMVKEKMTINHHIQQNVLQGDTDPVSRQLRLERWYRQLSQSQPVTIFEPALRTTETSGGCSCCG